MLEFLNKEYLIQIDLKSRIRTGMWLAGGMFLFILFFQPFGIVPGDLNNYNLIIAGFGGITLLLQGLIYLALPWSGPLLKSDKLNLKIILLFELLLWVFHAVAWSFYLRYVGHVPLSIFIVFRVVLISLVPPVVNLISYDFRDLRARLVSAIARNKELAELTDNRSAEENQVIELNSESQTESMHINLRSLVMIRSADNYVEVHYREEGRLRKKLLRTTLRNIESQLENHAVMVRCHRNCIVNISHVDQMKRTPTGVRLIMKGMEEDQAVSRQYLLGVKAALNQP